MSCVGCHRRRPRVLKLELGLRIVEAYGHRIALHCKALDTEVCGTPHLVQHHLCVGCFQNLLNRFLGNPQNMVFLVIGSDARHLFERIVPVD